MLREIISKLIDEYTRATQEPFAGHPLADYLRDAVPKQLASAFPDYPHLVWQASPGQGRWADAPWIAAFNPLVTTSAMREYYPVYLFTQSMDAVFLSLNQGMTDLRREFGDSQAKEILRHRAGILRARLAEDYPPNFDSQPIDLQSDDPSSRLSMYAPGHAFGKRYDRGNIPGDDRLTHDLGQMLQLYQLALSRGGTAEFDVGQPVADPLQPDLSAWTLDELRRYRLHRTIERNPRLAREAKRIHGYACQVCGLRFDQTYGDLGRDYIEAHHLTPLSQLPMDQTVRLSPQTDFAVVCANCHRMVHRTGAPPAFQEFVKLYRSLNPGASNGLGHVV